MRQAMPTLVVILFFMLFAAQPSAQGDDLPFNYKAVPVTPGKGESQRNEIFDDKGDKVAIQIFYPDGAREHQSLRQDGSVKFKHVLKKNGKSEHFDYYPDGKLMRETRDGVLRFERRKLPDGTFEAIRFKRDGKSPQMIRRVGPKGEFELIHFRVGKSQKVWFKSFIPGSSGKQEWHYFAEDGRRLRRVMLDDSMVVTVYDKASNFHFEQVWQQKKEDRVYVLQSVTIRLQNDLRRYVLKDDGKTVDRVEDLEPDGSVHYTWKPAEVDALPAEMLGEPFPDDDPTVPEQP